MRNYENGSRTADKFVVRLPAGLREEVDAASVAFDTSMNTVFVRAIRQYLDGQQRQTLLLDALEKAASARPNFDLDEHVKMVADARRYRQLRDREHRIGGLPTGSDLDNQLDDALRNEPMEATPCVS